jgi:flavin reductase (DIM6/NTAB) family NADH-FMN oxidoreductase RutF
MRKLWNHAPYPIWSLSTLDNTGTCNMNICSYVTPISMKPKEFIVGIYYNTQTFENISKTKHGLLQLLAKDQDHLVRQLGKKSSLKTNKMKKILKEESVGTHNSYTYLQECIGYIELEFYKIIKTSGDHAIGIARMKSHTSLQNKQTLTLQDLQEKNIIL